jgi:hypothetical protein
MRALIGDKRYNPTTQTLEIYDGNSWVVCDHAGRTSFDEDYVKKQVRAAFEKRTKSKALDELFGEK